MSADLSDLARALRQVRQERRRAVPPATLDEVRASIERMNQWRASVGFDPDPPDPDPPGWCGECHGGFRTTIEMRQMTAIKPNGSRVIESTPVRVATPCPCRRVAAGPASVVNLPAEFQDALIVNYRWHQGNRHARRAAEQFISGERFCLFIHGENIGCGKTRLATSLLREKAERGFAGVFVYVPDLIKLQQRGIYNEKPQRQAEELLYHANNAPVVLLDDLGAAEKRGSDFVRGEMLILLEHRLTRHMPTLLTSNHDLDGLTDFYGDPRIASRIARATEVETLKLSGPDERLVPRPTTPARLHAVKGVGIA